MLRKQSVHTSHQPLTRPVSCACYCECVTPGLKMGIRWSPKIFITWFRLRRGSNFICCYPGWLTIQLAYLLLICFILTSILANGQGTDKSEMVNSTTQSRSRVSFLIGNESRPRLRLRKINFVLNLQDTKQQAKSESPLKSLMSSSKSPDSGSDLLQPPSSSNGSVLLILVHSARGNFLEREIIRNTYGTVKTYKNWDIKIVFLLGKGSKDSQERKPFLHIRLAWEIEAHSDIVIGKFMDTFQNLVYKHIMGYRWTLRFFPKAKYVVKVDDDTFVDIFEILDYKIPKMSKGNATLFCTTVTKKHPDRNPDSERYTSVEQYPDATYPTYCEGSGYIVTQDGIRKLFSMITKVPIIRADDVYATGILRVAYSEGDPAKKLRIMNQKSNFQPDCSYTTRSKDRHSPFSHHKKKRAIVDEAWCNWKSALARSNRLQTQVKRFRMSARTL